MILSDLCVLILSVVSYNGSLIIIPIFSDSVITLLNFLYSIIPHQTFEIMLNKKKTIIKMHIITLIRKSTKNAKHTKNQNNNQNVL